MSDNNTINELRELLFETARGVKDGTIDPEKAKTISDLGQVIINSAKVEVDAIRASGAANSSTGFIPLAAPAGKTKTGSISHPAPGVTRHTLGH